MYFTDWMLKILTLTPHPETQACPHSGEGIIFKTFLAKLKSLMLIVYPEKDHG